MHHRGKKEKTSALAGISTREKEGKRILQHLTRLRGQAEKAATNERKKRGRPVFGPKRGQGGKKKSKSPLIFRPRSGAGRLTVRKEDCRGVDIGGKKFSDQSATSAEERRG